MQVDETKPMVQSAPASDTNRRSHLRASQLACRQGRQAGSAHLGPKRGDSERGYLTACSGTLGRGHAGHWLQATLAPNHGMG